MDGDLGGIIAVTHTSQLTGNAVVAVEVVIQSIFMQDKSKRIETTMPPPN